MPKPSASIKFQRRSCHCSFLKSSLNLAWGDIVLVVLAFMLLGVLLSRVLYKIGIREQPY